MLAIVKKDLDRTTTEFSVSPGSVFSYILGGQVLENGHTHLFCSVAFFI